MKTIIIFFALISIGKLHSKEISSCHSIKGEWLNEQGSLLSFTKIDKSTGMITGFYKSSSGTEGNSYPLIGWLNHAAAQKGKHNVVSISFSVRWGNHGSITSWSGTCSIEDGKSKINAIWNLVRSNSDYSWDHILTNHVTFTIKPK